MHPAMRRPLSVRRKYGSDVVKMQEINKKKIIAFSECEWSGRALSEPAHLPLPPNIGQAAITLLMKFSTTSRKRLA
ncbi:MAG: hypothetical protein H6Q99_162 [Proteobacteria bacterium]|nr:hypothetical protein [Pseudomonadota bacterium]